MKDRSPVGLKQQINENSIAILEDLIISKIREKIVVRTLLKNIRKIIYNNINILNKNQFFS